MAGTRGSAGTGRQAGTIGLVGLIPVLRSLIIFLLATTSLAKAQDPAHVPASQDTVRQAVPSKPKLTHGIELLPEVQVIANLNAARERIVPSLGATKRTLTAEQINEQPQGDNASLDQTLYHFPGVVQDELDKRLHVRGEEANLQYRINGVLLPDGLVGFGQELSLKFVDRLSLIVGTLPAQYGGRTAGIVDMETKTGVSANGGDLSLYGGSYSTINPSLDYGAAAGRWTCYLSLGGPHDAMGMANPTASFRPLHDDTNQYKGLASLSYVIDPTSRLSLILSSAYASFQLPDTPGQTALFQYDSLKTFPSSQLNEKQDERNSYEVLAYQKKIGALNLQVAQSARYGDILFEPDVIGDLMFNGVAARAEHRLTAVGLSGDASYPLNERHMLRGGFSLTGEMAAVNTLNWVFPAAWSSSSSSWEQTGFTPKQIVDDNDKRASLYSGYLQDEWQVRDQLTINYGLRFDGLHAYLDEQQLSPRINLVYHEGGRTTWQAGYARYFTPPPLELVPTTSIDRFVDTTHGADPGNSTSDPVRSERYHYFDAGLVHRILPELQVGIEGYYKIKKWVLDEGQFGPAMIFSPNNAERGLVRGVELMAGYDKNGIGAYANLAFSRAKAYGLTSGQFQFDPDELAFLQTHWYHLDHDQDITASAGVSCQHKGTKVCVDALYGSGLYGGFGNQTELPPYGTVNLGAERLLGMAGPGRVKIRVDVVNLFDKVYEIRDGQGVGVFAPQYLPRRGLYGGLSWGF